MIKPSKIYKMRIVFRWVTKRGQRNVLGALRHMICSSGLDFVPAKINEHWPRLAYGPSLAKGQQAQREYVDIYLQSSIPAAEVKDALSKQTPAGLELLEVYRVPYALASVQQLATVAVYDIEGNFAAYEPAETLQQYISAAHLPVVQQAPNGMKLTTDLKPFVVEVIQVNAAQIRLTMRCVATKWINPLWVIYGWLGQEIDQSLEETADENFSVIRQGLYWEDSLQQLHLI